MYTRSEWGDGQRTNFPHIRLLTFRPKDWEYATCRIRESTIVDATWFRGVTALVLHSLCLLAPSGSETGRDSCPWTELMITAASSPRRSVAFTSASVPSYAER